MDKIQREFYCAKIQSIKKYCVKFFIFTYIKYLLIIFCLFIIIIIIFWLLNEFFEDKIAHCYSTNDLVLDISLLQNSGNFLFNILSKTLWHPSFLQWLIQITINKYINYYFIQHINKYCDFLFVLFYIIIEIICKCVEWIFMQITLHIGWQKKIFESSWSHLKFAERRWI